MRCKPEPLGNWEGKEKWWETLKSLEAAGVFVQRDGGTADVLSLERKDENGRSRASEGRLRSVAAVANGSAACVCGISKWVCVRVLFAAGV